MVSETINSVILSSKKLIKLNQNVIKNVINKMEVIIKDKENEKAEILLILNIFKTIFKEINNDFQRIVLFSNLIKHFFEVVLTYIYFIFLIW